MSDFTVSARKYRPGTFGSVLGQEHVSNTLRNAIKLNKIAHAFLFTGPRGVGKTTSARIFAKAINCENLQDGEPCNECVSCKNFNEGRSFNIYELDAASNNGVEYIRELNDQVRIPPQYGKYKIIIIDEVHMLSQAAFNAFLKTLEEPPAHAKFILATTEKHKILPTILSRCQIYDFKRITPDDAVKNLEEICEKEGITAEKQALYLIGQKADGAMRDALSIFDRLVSYKTDKQLTYQDVIENLNILDYEYYFKLTQLVYEENLTETLVLFNQIMSLGFDGHQFVVGFLEHFRNLMFALDPKTAALIESSTEVVERYKEQSKIVGPSLLLTALNILNQVDLNFKQSKNPRLLVELNLMKLCHLKSSLTVAQITTAEKKK